MSEANKTEYIDAFTGDSKYPMSGEMFESFVEFYVKGSQYSDFNKEAYDYALQEQHRRLTEAGQNADEIMNGHIHNVFSKSVGALGDNKYAGAFVDQIDYTNFTGLVDASHDGLASYTKFVADEGLLTDAMNSIKMGDYAPSHAEAKEMREKAKMYQKQMGISTDNSAPSNSLSSIWSQVTSNPSAQSIVNKLKEICTKIKEWTQNTFENITEKRLAMAESSLSISEDSPLDDLEAGA